MKTKYSILTVLAAFLLVVFTETALAQQQKEIALKQRMVKKHAKHQQKGMRFARLPDLTDEQREEITSVMLATRQRVMPLQNEMREKRARLKSLRTASEADLDVMNTVVEEIGELRTEIMKERVAAEQDIRLLLTDEQRIVYDSRRHRMDRHRSSGWFRHR